MSWMVETGRSVAGRSGYVVGLILNVVGLVQLIRGSGMNALIWVAVGGWVLFISTFWELSVRVRTSSKPEVIGSNDWLISHALDVEKMLVGKRAYFGPAIASGDVRWPDGSPGEYQADDFDSSGAVNSYTVTYLRPGHHRIVKQPAVHRDYEGNVTNRPPMTVAGY